MKPESSFDEIADALGHQIRRQVLVELMEHDLVAYREIVVESTGRDARETEVQLVHNHLPKLAEMDYIAWDRDDETVVKGPDWEEVEPALRSLDDLAGFTTEVPTLASRKQS